jgi:sulfatase maturation enzyme AslB (radical SAM superfamily)
MDNSINELRKEIVNSETFCFYPFLELSTNPAGHLKPCCYYSNVLFRDEEGDYTNIYSITKNSTLEEVWNSRPMIEIRRQLVEGEVNKNCDTCYRDGPASMRVRSISEYKNNAEVLTKVQDTILNGYETPYLPSRLELKPSNLCNLKCVMCNSYDSTQVAKELVELSTKFKGINVKTGRFISINLEQPGITETHAAFEDVEVPDWSDNDELWNSFVKIAPGLEHLSFAGGEPTLIPFVQKVLDYCVEQDYAKNIRISVASNFTNMNKNFLEVMPKFKRFEIIASIDGIGLVNDYCRYPSKWSQISSNYEKTKQLTKYSNVKIMTNITVNFLNVMNLDQLLYWIEDHADRYPYFRQYPYNINLIWSPSDQRIEHLPKHLKDIAIQRLERYKETSNILKEFPGMISRIDLVLNELKKQGSEYELEQFKKRLKVLDTHREINVVDYIPDLGDVFNE